MNIKLLDCTLRDGGYINNWSFGNNTILNIFRKLVDSNIEIIEVGFLDDRVEENINKSIMPNTKILNDIFKNEVKKNSTVVAMIDYGTCDINNIDNCSETFIDGIRIIFKKKDIDNALVYSKLLKNKGYKVFIQPVSITSYTVTEFYNLIQKVNHINPFAMSIVDTYGLMHIDELLKYFKIIKNFLNKSIYIGYHSHNNLQLSFANCIELLRKCNRDDNIILDSTLYGMGKFAGNTNTELLSKYLNENYGKKYDIDLILQVIDEEIVKIYNKSQWGYNLSNYLSAENRCHPKYVKYLMDKDDLSIQQVTNILKRLNNNLIFDEKIMKKYVKEINCKIKKE